MSKSKNTPGASAGRKRPWTVVFYGSETELKHILVANRARIAHYAYKVHDKDIYAEDLTDEKGNIVHKAGEEERVHIHLLLDFFNGHTFRVVKKMFTTDTDNPRVEPVSDRVAQYRYLIHADDPDKYQYDKSGIMSNDINYYEKLCVNGDRKDTDNLAEQIVNDMLCGVSPRVMLSRYGRDYVIHYRQYREVVEEIKHFDDMEKWRKQESEQLDKRVSIEEIEAFNKAENPFGD